MNVTFEQVRDIVADAISCDLEQVKPETNLYDDLEIDSLDAVELSMALQEALGREIHTSPLTQYNGALGAALFAYQKYLKAQK